MVSRQKCILRIILPVPLRRYFDYLPPENARIEELQPGIRVCVPFGKNKEYIGILLSVSGHSDVAENRLRRIRKIIDQSPVLPKNHMSLLEWASGYYHHPMGEVFFNALPKSIRLGKTPVIHHDKYWRITPAGKKISGDTLANAPIQSFLLELFKNSDQALTQIQLQETTRNWRSPLRQMIRKGFVEECDQPNIDKGSESHDERVTLNADQEKVCKTLQGSFHGYHPFLLEGVTGSGKTEVYMQAIQETLATGKQALVLLPEIGLTPQIISRFRQRFSARLAVLHSALTDNERANSWLEARDGTAGIILGTRSAIWTPLFNPGIYIVDEEHDPSYKQQDGFRYSARDIALFRGKRDKTPVILGSATPSMETLQNTITGRYQHIVLPERAGDAIEPTIRIVDIRGKKMFGPVSESLMKLIEGELHRNKQVLLFLNRRGYASTILCHQCGWAASCLRCDLPFTYHKLADKLCCHHCGSQKPVPHVCPECSNENLLKIGHGTERIEEVLQRHLPDARIVRIDRDTTRRRGSIKSILDAIQTGEVDILVGTQMLAKGHHFPKVTLAGIIDADRGLFGSDFRASERLAQLLIQVSGRAGRANDIGNVIIQTHYPDHALLTTLIKSGYSEFSRLLLRERKLACLPPFSYLALLRAESHDKSSVLRFLDEARSRIISINHMQLEVFGPVSAPQEKRVGRYRMQLLIQSANRTHLRKTLEPWVPALESLSSGRRVRWSLDVDPQDMI